MLDDQRDIFWTSLEHAVLAQTKSLDQDVRNHAVAVQNNNQGGDNGNQGGNNGGYPPGYDPDADDDPGV